MLYLATASGPLVCSAIDAGLLGFMNTPNVGNTLRPSWTWGADNGCFSDQWDESRWWSFLVRHMPAVDRCVFAVAPDVYADADATTRLFAVWSDRIRSLGYPVAYVGQDGLSPSMVPWDGIDVWFTGGSTAWKLSADAQRFAADARFRGKHAHMGRVNTLRRLRFAAAHEYDSVDGTCLARGPDTNLPKMLRYLRRADEPALFRGL